MSKKRPGRGGPRQDESEDDDAALWTRTAQTVSPLKKSKPRVHTATAENERKQEHAPSRATERAPHKGKPAVPSAPVTSTAKKAVPPIAEFDRAKAKKLRSGRAGIEARIDLHGMRQDEAHAALNAFLHRSRARGLRLVLVITGKGRKDEEDRDMPFDMSRNRDRGVLKRNVPRWLEEPELRAIVVSYTTAAIAHGGEGALYVHLRKPQ